MSKWPLVAIDDLVEDIIDRRGVTPFKLGSSFTAIGHRVISAKLIKFGAIDLAADEPRYVDERTYSRWMRSPLRADDVILTSEAPLGEVAYLRSDVDWVLGQRLFALRSDKRCLHGRWLYYALQTDPSRSDLLSRATGTTAQGIRQTELRRVRILLPPLNEQRRIADILGALDDRIALNERMAATLETLGRFTYRSWRETLPQTDFCPIGDVCQVSSGGTPARRNEELWAGPIPWISPKVMTSIHCDEPEEWVSPAAIGHGTRLAPAGSTLVMVRGMGLHERVRVSQAREDVTFNQDVKSLTPVDLEPAMLLFSVLDAQEVLLARVESSGHGTGVLPTSALTGHLVAAPRAEVVSRRVVEIEALDGEGHRVVFSGCRSQLRRPTRWPQTGWHCSSRSGPPPTPETSTSCARR